MMASSCQAIKKLLGPFIDHELSGAAMLRVSQHLVVCPRCTGEARALASMGDRLREAAGDELPRNRLDAMASGVVARVRAESALSWTARLERAAGDTRLLWVGTGSLLGAMASMLIVAAALFLGQTPAQPNSPSATLDTAGTLFVIATPETGGASAFLVQVNRGDSGVERRVITEATLVDASEIQLLGLLAEAVTRQGHIVELSEMGDQDRRFTEALLDNINRRQSKELVPVTLQQLRLVATVDVSAKGL